MTIGVGFKCTDGIVLCTDSLESDGVTKRMVDKIWASVVSCKHMSVALRHKTT
jgi:hypothetical protein